MSPLQTPELESLSLGSSLAVLLRMLYRMVLDYCVLDMDGVILFSKDQLISLIERCSPDTPVESFPQLVEQGLLKPLSILDSSYVDSDQLRVLLIDHEGAKVSTMQEATAPREPRFPEWWDVPLPLVLRSRKKLYANHTAGLLFGSDLERIAVGELPDKEEFLIELDGSKKNSLLMFRQLRPGVFVLEDCTSDVSDAQDITWWAAIGKAWVESLVNSGQTYRCCTEEEFKQNEMEWEYALPCVWEGQPLGYFCVKKTEQKNKKESVFHPEKKASAAASKAKGRPKSKLRQTKQQVVTPEQEALVTLGPQAMGFLAPTSHFMAPEQVFNSEEKSVVRKRTEKTPRNTGSRTMGKE